MIDLYHCVAARSFRPLWALEELRLPYRLHMLAFPPRATDKTYLQLNPLGTVPLFIDNQVRMTESAAICHYLAATHGDGSLLVAPDDAEFGSFLNWTHFGEATLTFPQTIVLRYERFETAERKLPQAATDYRRWFLGRLRTIAPRLMESDYICADRFTVADISIGYALLLASFLEMAPEFPEPVQRYWERLQQRDGFKMAQRAETAAAREQGVSEIPAPSLLVP